ncbi:MAG: metallophosphoesterase family protein [Acidimicrobiales bacterium]
MTATDLPRGLVVEASDGPNPWTHLGLPDAGPHFSFVLVSDRTGGARPGVFERGLAVTDLLAPAFAVQLGDLIEGYSDEADTIEEEWAEIDRLFEGMRTPVFHTPGNHDVSSPYQREVWQRRYGRLFFHFRYHDALFCILDTQDDPAAPDPHVARDVDAFLALVRRDPRRARLGLGGDAAWNGLQPASLGEEQLAYFEDVLARHADARWTFVIMHMPLWQGDHPAWARLRAALGPRRYHAFAGHVHNYRHEHLGGNAHIRLGPTGGLWVLGGPEGNFDHVTLVTVTGDGPVVANILLEGVRDVDGEAILPVATRSVPVF